MQLRALLDQLVLAFSLLTRLPVLSFWTIQGTVDMRHGVWAWPLAGAVVGGVSGTVLHASNLLGLPSLVAALLALTASVLMTGGLHEDGLADTADGFGGGRTRADKLDIMRDSRVGSYGVLALVLSTGLRTTAMAAVLDTMGPTPTICLLIAIGALARTSMLSPLLLLPAARPDGLAAGFSQTPWWPSLAAMIISVVIAAVALPLALAAGLVLVGLFAPLPLIGLAKRQIGGQTGDLLGATALLTECALLVFSVS